MYRLWGYNLKIDSITLFLIYMKQKQTNKLDHQQSSKNKRNNGVFFSPAQCLLSSFPTPSTQIPTLIHSYPLPICRRAESHRRMKGKKGIW